MVWWAIAGILIQRNVQISKRFVNYWLIFITVCILMYYNYAINFSTEISFAMKKLFEKAFKIIFFSFLFSSWSVISHFFKIYWAYLSFHHRFLQMSCQVSCFVPHSLLCGSRSSLYHVANTFDRLIFVIVRIYGYLPVFYLIKVTL